MILQELKKIRGEKKEWRKFGILFAFLFALLGGWRLYLGQPYWMGLCGIGGLFLLAALCKPVALKPFYWCWMALAVFLGNIVSRLILVATFYCVITPVGWMMRLFGGGYSRKSKGDSHWIAKESAAGRGGMEKQF